MLLSVTRWSGAKRQPQLSVFAYDIASARRAYRVRRVLAGLRCNGQYSVCELHLTVPQLHDLLAELSTLCDPQADRLASWRPRNEKVMALDGGGRLLVRSGTGGVWQPITGMTHDACGGNFMICYDITEPEAVLTVGRKVAACATAVQRSVYWLRGAVGDLVDLAHRCAPHLGAADRFWIYPLASSSHLWRVQENAPCVLPVAIRETPGNATSSGKELR